MNAFSCMSPYPIYAALSMHVFLWMPYHACFQAATGTWKTFSNQTLWCCLRFAFSVAMRQNQQTQPPSGQGCCCHPRDWICKPAIPGWITACATCSFAHARQLRRKTWKQNMLAQVQWLTHIVPAPIPNATCGLGRGKPMAHNQAPSSYSRSPVSWVSSWSVCTPSCLCIGPPPFLQFKGVGHAWCIAIDNMQCTWIQPASPLHKWHTRADVNPVNNRWHFPQCLRPWQKQANSIFFVNASRGKTMPWPVSTNTDHPDKHCLLGTVFFFNLMQPSMHVYTYIDQSHIKQVEASTSQPCSRSSFKSLATAAWSASKVSTPSSPVA